MTNDQTTTTETLRTIADLTAKKAKKAAADKARRAAKKAAAAEVSAPVSSPPPAAKELPGVSVPAALWLTRVVNHGKVPAKGFPQKIRADLTEAGLLQTSGVQLTATDLGRDVVFALRLARQAAK